MTEQREIERPCPECETSGWGRSRIGNRRSTCKTCNAFARRLERRVNARLRWQAGNEVLGKMTEELEGTLYAQLIEG